MYVSGVCVGVQIFGVKTKHRLLRTEEQELLYDLYSESAYEDTRCPQGGAFVTNEPSCRSQGTLTEWPYINWEFGCGADVGQMCSLYSHRQILEVSLDFTDEETKGG